MTPRPLWVTGWLMQFVLHAVGAGLAWKGLINPAATFIVGGCIIGVIRQIEAERWRANARRR